MTILNSTPGSRRDMQDLSVGRVARAVRFVSEKGLTEVFRLLRDHGWRGTFNFFGRNVRHIVADRIARRWDLNHGVDTAGSIQIESLQVAGPNRKYGNECVCTSPSTFDFIMRNVPQELSRHVFIDIGAGKSRTLLLASRYGFAKVMGVEFAKELAELSRKNITDFKSDAQKCSNLEIIEGDAALFAFPDQPLVVFLYNPFSQEIFDIVLSNLVSSLKAHNRDCYLIYGSSSHNAIGWAKPAIEYTGQFVEIPTPPTPMFWDAVRTISFAIFHSK